MVIKILSLTLTYSCLQMVFNSITGISRYKQTFFFTTIENK